LSRLLEKYSSLRWALKPQAWLLEGAERASGEPLKILYAGTEPHKNYFASIAFKEGWKESPKGGLLWWLVRRRALAEKATLAVYQMVPEQSRFYKPKSDFKAPVWIRSDMDVPADAAALRGTKKWREIGRSFDKRGYAWTSSRQVEDFDLFYKEMYVPHARRRHDASVVFHPHEELRRIFEATGEVLFLELDGKRVAGAITDYAPPLPHFLYYGVLEGHDNSDVADALLHARVLRLIEQGIRRVSLGHSRPFLKDGALRYKAERGAAPVDAHYVRSGFVHLAILDASAGLRSFFENNPFFGVRPDGRFRPVFFMRGPEEALSEAVATWRTRAGDVDLYLWSNGRPAPLDPSTVPVPAPRATAAVPATAVLR